MSMALKAEPVAPRPQRGKKRSGGRAGKPDALALAWGLFLLVVVALAAWLLMTAGDTRRRYLAGAERVIFRLGANAPAGKAATAAAAAAAAGHGAGGAPAAHGEAGQGTGPASLVAVPDPALIELAVAGSLPRIGPNGRKAWQAYARPFEPGEGAAAELPRIGILVTGLGLTQTLTDLALDKLPPEASLAFNPYSDQLSGQVALARARGHETLVMLGMEPSNFPNVDPGPYSLLTSLAPETNIGRMEWVLARSPGAIGVVSDAGDAFLGSQRYLQPVLRALDQRGLMFVDSRPTTASVGARVARDVGLPRAFANQTLSPELSEHANERLLDDAAATARGSGAAVIVLPAHPALLDLVEHWTQDLKRRGVVLAPVSAIADRQPDL